MKELEWDEFVVQIVMMKWTKGGIYEIAEGGWTLNETWKWLCVLIVILEILFYLYIHYTIVPAMHPKKAADATTLQAQDVADRIAEVLDILERKKSYNLETFVRRWFLGAKLEDIGEVNLLRMVSWGLLQKHDYELTDKERKVVLETIAKYKEKLPEVTLPEGETDVQHVRFTLDPVKVTHRPLLFYSFMYTKNFLTRLLLYARGYQRYDIRGIKYWYCECPRSRRLPIVFFHGISTGLTTYLYFLSTLMTERTMILVEQPYIAMTLSLHVPTKQEMVEAVRSMMKIHGIPRACFMGHSFGSIPVTWMAQTYPDLVAQMVLLDPVSILLCLPEVAVNFLYKEPRTIPEWFINVLAATDLSIAHTLRRNFWWFDNTLWREDIKCPTTVGLAGHDEIVNTACVRDYLTHHASENPHLDIRMHYFPKHTHGQVIFLPHLMHQIIDSINEQENQIKKGYESGALHKVYT